jgi:hypothetical protein
MGPPGAGGLAEDDDHLVVQVEVAGEHGPGRLRDPCAGVEEQPEDGRVPPVGEVVRPRRRAAGHLQTIKPIPLQSAVPDGFAFHDFRIDTQPGMVRCPAGQVAPITSSGRVSFARQCQGCPLPRRCTTAKAGRTIHLHRHEGELRAARCRAVTRTFQESYRRWRAMMERSIAWLVADGCRRVPYRGIERNQLWWSLRVAAVNLRRLLMLGLARRDGVWVLA